MSDKALIKDTVICSLASLIREAGVRSVLIGLSGGADSVALLRAAAALEEKGMLKVEAAHCNFNLRGAESMRDEEFCRSLCARLGIPLRVKSFDTMAYASLHKLSVEEACRRLRYDWWFDLVDRGEVQRVAVAHHADDNAETLLLNLLRGSGLTGLKAMLPDTGRVLRPFLSLRRSRIMEYLQTLGQPFVTDSSNLESDYRRNFLRNEVIPLLQSRWPDAVGAISKSAGILRSEWQVLRNTASGKSRLPWLADASVPTHADAVTLLYHFIQPYGGTPAIAAEAARCIARDDDHPGSGQWWRLRDGRLCRERNGFEILPPGPMPLAGIRGKLVDMQALNPEELRANDPARIFLPGTDAFAPGNLTVRRWRPADTMIPFGRRGPVKVSKLMKDARLSRAGKEELPVMTDAEGRILWAAGLRRSALFPVDGTCPRVWRYTLCPPDNL